jgi:predicted nucleotidyltransferase
LFDLLDIQEYFEGITNRPVDIVEVAGLTNPYRRDAILKTKEILYVA